MEAESEAPGQKSGFRRWVGRGALALSFLLLVLGAATWLAGRAARSELIQQYPAPGQLVDVGGYTMHLNCMGQGSPTVIMEAGLGDFSIFWTQVQPEVSRFSRVCVYDRAGFGWSEPVPSPRTIETMATELHALLTNAEIETPYLLVGHSFGGLIVRLYAHNYPEEVAGMVLVDPMHEEQDLRLPAYGSAGMKLIQQFRLLTPLREIGIIALYPQRIPNPGLPEEAFAQYGSILATTNYFEASNAERLALERSLAEFRAADLDGPGDMPLIVLSRGLQMSVPGLSEAEIQQTEAIWSEMQQELVALSSNSRQIIAGGSGHNVHLQQPELVVEAIRHFAVAVTAKTPNSALQIDAVAEATKPLSPAPMVTARPEPTPTPSPEPTQAAPLAEVEFTLRTVFEAGRMLYVGVGGDIDGIVSPDLAVAPGTIIRVALVNDDGISHDLFFPDFGAQSAAIGRKGQTTEVTFTVPAAQPAGTFVYYCTKPGHRQAGQEGWLIVRGG